MARGRKTNLKALVEADRGEGKGRFDDTLRERLLSYAEQRWREGATTREVADELGMSQATVAYWRARRSPELRPVQVVAEHTLEPEKRFRLSGPCGTALEDVTLGEVAELWRKLS